MSGGDERLRAAFAALADGPPGAEPAPAERVWQAAHGELPPEEVRALAEQAAACPETAEAWRLALALRAEPGVATVVPLRRRPRWVALGLAAAAAVLAGAVLVPLLGPPERLRDAAFAVEPLVRPGAVLPADAFVLRWSAGPPGTTYDVEVADERLEPLARADGLVEPHLQVPPEALVGLPSGAEVLWRVRAHQPDGTTVESRAFSVRLE